MLIKWLPVTAIQCLSISYGIFLVCKRNVERCLSHPAGTLSFPSIIVLNSHKKCQRLSFFMFTCFIAMRLRPKRPDFNSSYSQLILNMTCENIISHSVAVGMEYTSKLSSQFVVIMNKCSRNQLDFSQFKSCRLKCMCWFLWLLTIILTLSHA